MLLRDVEDVCYCSVLVLRGITLHVELGLEGCFPCCLPCGLVCEIGTFVAWLGVNHCTVSVNFDLDHDLALFRHVV